MLSYRHAFHAGNHADMLKHFTLFLVLEYFNRKDKPYWYIDTHSGAGLYDLSGDEAQKVGEYKQGIALLEQADKLPAELAEFIGRLKQILPQDNLYCGSPWLAQALTRDSDKMRLFELHPADFVHLQNNMREVRPTRKVQVSQADGYQGLISLLPPPPRRAAVLIDPPYEEKQDYRRVIQVLKDALKRFETGCYMVWYPCLSRTQKNRSRQLSARRASCPYAAQRRLRHARQRHVRHQSALYACRTITKQSARAFQNFGARCRRALCIGKQNEINAAV